MIYITGDTHGDIDLKYVVQYFKDKHVTRQDYLIILGDAGIVWSEKDCYISEYDNLGLTILFIDGNHENFDLLNTYPVVEYHGARCHQLNDNIYHILRGEIINLNGLSFFCMGGATSIDKALRREHISWWNDENINKKDIDNGLSKLEKVNNKVDYVLTHTAPTSIVWDFFNYDEDHNTDILEEFKKIINFKYWFFGHYHFNKDQDKFECIYQRVIMINC